MTEIPHRAGPARAKPDEVLLPAPDCDLLSGHAQIGRWFGLSAGQTNARIDDGSIVTFKMPPRNTVFALKSENAAHWKAAAAAHRGRNGAGDPDSGHTTPNDDADERDRSAVR